MERRVFYIFSLLFLIVYTCQKLEVALPAIINNHLNDFLCLPIVLHLCRQTVRRFTGYKAYTLSLFTSLSVAAYYAAYFEYFMPKVNSRYTADLIDVILYFSGAALYYILQRQAALKEIKHYNMKCVKNNMQ